MSLRSQVLQLKLGHRVLFGLAGVIAAACASQGAPLIQARMDLPKPEQSAGALCFHSVVFVAIDGVRSEHVFSPARPNNQLEQLSQMQVDGAAWGHPNSAGFFASGPNFVSLPGYMEMLSGTSDLHCTENDCKTMRHPTLLDDFSGKYGYGSSAVIASWPNVATAASVHPEPAALVSAGAHLVQGNQRLRPKTRSMLETGQENYARGDGYRHDAGTSQLALTYLEEHRPRFMFVSLGDTDEYAHQNDRDGYFRSLELADNFVGKIRRAHGEMRAEGKRTLLVVTTDHGRADSFTEHGRHYPESAKSFLFMEGSEIPARGPVLDAPARYLRDIAPTVRSLCGLPQGENESGQVLEEILAGG